MKNNELNWTVISCRSSPDEEESFSWILFEQGALGLEIIDIDTNTVSIKASFRPKNFSKENFAELHYRLKNMGLEKAAKTLQLENIPNEDWLHNWKKHFEPFAIGNSFLICPPWHYKNIPAKLKENRTIIIIDPGMAFGTGLHATTSYCLQAIERSAIGSTILDAGTGSGILSIACAKTIPHAKIIALDIDAEAIANAKHNIALNHIHKQIELRQESPEQLLNSKNNYQKFDTILSNLTAEVIIDLLPSYDRLLNTNGTLILAGIIEERLGIIENALSKYQFKLINKTSDRGWVGLTLTKVQDKSKYPKAIDENT